MSSGFNDRHQKSCQQASAGNDAGGIQINANKRMGLYLEPELVWTGGKPSTAEERVYPEGWYGYEIPTEESIGLQTYRTEHPFMFSISTGLRINLGK